MANDPDGWDAEAPAFDAEPDHGLSDPQVRAAWWRLLSGVLPAPPARVADLGSGTGTLSVLLAERGHAVDGVDFSPQMVERARAKADAAGVAARFTVGDAADPDLDRAAYDVVLSRHVLWAMPDPAAAFARWVGLLRTGGRVVLVEGNWSTGAGLTATEALRIVEATGLRGVVRPMPEPAYWGRQITDERYLLLAE